jgi:CheY-like chemotaxis protein
MRGLQSRGFDVDLAQDGEQCLEKIRSFKPDLIVLDIMMPKVHGIDILKMLKADTETEQIGVIVCTAKSFKTEQDFVNEFGAFDIVEKPLDMNDLLDKVGRFFSKSDMDEHQAPSHLARTREIEAFHPSIEAPRGRFRLWGTRGSIPVSGPHYVRHGGNTSCMEVRCGEELIIFDAGSGIRNLGLALMKDKPRKLHLFITHTHWDHIQGFPFFTPAYVPDFDITIYGARGFGKDLKSIFQGQLDRDYFPVQMEDMNAHLKFKSISPQPIQIGNYTITWEFTHHPGATVGYKIDIDEKKVGWIPDNEFLKGYLGKPDSISIGDEIVAPYLKLLKFMSDIDIVISEAQYTTAEYVNKIGWGHVSVPNACLLMKLANIKKWIVTHHDPMHDDDFLQDKLNLTRQLLQRINHPIDVSHGYDGMIEYL